jgi:hypothetical protein
MPTAEPDDGPAALVSSDIELEHHIKVLRARKAYEGADGNEEQMFGAK